MWCLERLSVRTRASRGPSASMESSPKQPVARLQQSLISASCTMARCCCSPKMATKSKPQRRLETSTSRCEPSMLTQSNWAGETSRSLSLSLMFFFLSLFILIYLVMGHAGLKKYACFFGTVSLKKCGPVNFRDSNPFLLHGESELKHTETDWNCIVLVRWRNINKTKQTLELVTRHPHAGFLRDLSRNPSVSFLHLHGCTFHEFQGTCEAGWDDADLVFLPKLCKPLEVRMRKCTKLHHGDKRMHGTFAHDDPSIRVELHCAAEEPRERAKGSHFCRSLVVLRSRCHMEWQLLQPNRCR